MHKTSLLLTDSPGVIVASPSATMTYDVNDQAEKSLLESKYRRSQELRASFDYETFADAAEDACNADAEERRFPKGGRESHSGWLLKRYQTDGPEVQWKKRWFYLLDDRLCVSEYPAHPAAGTRSNYVPRRRHVLNYGDPFPSSHPR